MSTHENTSSEKRDVYTTVTNQIVNAIEKGVGNWRMPWHTSGKFAFSPINVVSKKPYRGVNTLCLWAAAQTKGYERGEWATYQQWQEVGGQVRRGEKATTVVFWKFAHGTAENQDGEDEQPQTISRLLFTRGYAVFNAAQVDGYNPKANGHTLWSATIRLGHLTPPLPIDTRDANRRGWVWRVHENLHATD